MTFNSTSNNRWLKIAAYSIIAFIGLFSFAPQAIAHHPFGGQTPDNLWEGLLSGIAHPIIGLDHLAFVVASGLLACGLNQGVFIPVAFVLATMIGTGIHLQEIDLPAPEMIIAASVVIFGGLLAVRNSRDNPSYFYNIVLAAVAAIAGIFHGYAYGEAIVGAQMTPLIAYLAGFATIQLVIAVAALAFGSSVLKNFSEKSFPIMRFFGLTIGAIGMVFLTSSVMG